MRQERVMGYMCHENRDRDHLGRRRGPVSQAEREGEWRDSQDNICMYKEAHFIC